MRPRRMLAAMVAATLTTGVLLATSGSAQAKHTSRSGSIPPLNPVVKIGGWAGYATESFEQYGIEQQPDWHVHVTSVTNCTDLGTDSLGTCTVTGDIFFHVVTRTVNGKQIKTCEPFYDVAGNNAFTQYHPSHLTGASTGYEIDGAGTGLMSPAYDDDQSQPVHAQSHLHFETSTGAEETHTVVITGLAAPIRACSVVRSTDKVAVAGSIFLIG